MKKIINYEKEIIFKTTIAEICSISLEQDFTVDDNCFTGDFILTGEYKTNELSVNKEPFTYHLPIEYELDNGVDYNSVNYEIDNFEYTVEDDVLKVTIDLAITYDEVEKEVLPTISEEEINNEVPIERDVREEEVTINEEKKQILTSEFNDETFTTYHVHIVGSEDNLESIAKKYGVTIDDIKKYNDDVNLELKSKLIIPESDND